MSRNLEEIESGNDQELPRARFRAAVTCESQANCGWLVERVFDYLETGEANWDGLNIDEVRYGRDILSSVAGKYPGARLTAGGDFLNLVMTQDQLTASLNAMEKGEHAMVSFDYAGKEVGHVTNVFKDSGGVLRELDLQGSVSDYQETLRENFLYFLIQNRSQLDAEGYGFLRKN